MNHHLFWISLLLSLLPLQVGEALPIRKNLETTVRQLTSAGFQGRAFRTEGGHKAAEYLAGLFREAGLSSPAGVKDFLQPIEGGGQNVIGLIRSRGPQSRDEYILVTAHYDSFGAPFFGAADNAAGVAVMIELARLASAGELPRNILFVAFDGGEQNRAGAEFYASHPAVPIEKTVATVGLRNFGRGMSDYLPERLYLFGAERSAQLRAVLDGRSPELSVFGLDTLNPLEREYFDLSAKKIPFLLVTNGHHYTTHHPQDVPGRLNFAAMAGHVAALSRLLSGLAAIDGRIEWSEDPVYDAREAADWERVLTALRAAVIPTPANQAGQAQLDEIVLELKRFRGRALQDPKARDSVILRAARACWLIADPNAAEYSDLRARARGQELRGEPVRATLEKLLKLMENEYRRGDQEMTAVREKLRALPN